VGGVLKKEWDVMRERKRIRERKKKGGPRPEEKKKEKEGKKSSFGRGTHHLIRKGGVCYCLRGREKRRPYLGKGLKKRELVRKATRLKEKGRKKRAFCPTGEKKPLRAFFSIKIDNHRGGKKKRNGRWREWRGEKKRKEVKELRLLGGEFLQFEMERKFQTHGGQNEGKENATSWYYMAGRFHKGRYP